MATMYEIFTSEARYVQRLLRFGGFKQVGAVDGIVGRKTRAGQVAWEALHYTYRDEHAPVDARSEGNIQSLCPLFALKVRKLLLAVNAALAGQKGGRQFRVICGTRTYKEQAAEYAKGRTVKGAKVTNAKAGQSMHNFGVAADFCLFAGSEPVWEGEEYDLLGKLAREAGLEWGGAWKSLVDKPHVQLPLKGDTAAICAAFETASKEAVELL